MPSLPTPINLALRDFPIGREKKIQDWASNDYAYNTLASAINKLIIALELFTLLVTKDK